MQKAKIIFMVLLFHLPVSFSALCKDSIKTNGEIIEAKEITKSGSKISRVNSTLRVRLENGVIIGLSDVDSDGEDRRIHRYIGLDNYTKYYTFEILHLEWTTILEINPEDGQQLTFPRIPIYSPLYKYTFCFEESGLNAANIIVYKINEKSFKKVFEYVFIDWDAANLQWIDDSTIKFDAFEHTNTTRITYPAVIKCYENKCRIIKKAP